MTDPKAKFGYYVEKRTLEATDRPRRFLEAFAAVLEHSSYHLPLDVYSRAGARCGQCAADCQLYQSTGEDRDIPGSRRTSTSRSISPSTPRAPSTVSSRRSPTTCVSRTR